jgi:2-polyprenyl-3-methyl-5-hydroxy-6-metoxy-1,4-benzoquinol methylase
LSSHALKAGGLSLEDAEQRLRAGWAPRSLLAEEICPSNARVLDVGCSWGEYTLPLCGRAEHVTALDIDGSALDRLERLAQERGITNVTTSSESLHTHDGDYDLIWCTNTVSVLRGDERRAFLSSFRRLLAPEGRVFVDYYTPRYLAFRAVSQEGLTPRLRVVSAARLVTLRYTLTARKFRREVVRSGLRIQSIVESPALVRSREIEGNDFSTRFGNYFEAYLLGHGHGDRS